MASEDFKWSSNRISDLNDIYLIWINKNNSIINIGTTTVKMKLLICYLEMAHNSFNVGSSVPPYTGCLATTWTNFDTLFKMSKERKNGT